MSFGEYGWRMSSAPPRLSGHISVFSAIQLMPPKRVFYCTTYAS